MHSSPKSSVNSLSLRRCLFVVSVQRSLHYEASALANGNAHCSLSSGSCFLVVLSPASWSLTLCSVIQSADCCVRLSLVVFCFSNSSHHGLSELWSMFPELNEISGLWISLPELQTLICFRVASRTVLFCFPFLRHAIPELPMIFAGSCFMRFLVVYH